MDAKIKEDASVTLCIVFNHPFPKNIPLLRSIYKDRFSNVVFLQPILQSPDNDVFTTARGSYNFSGSIGDYLLNNRVDTDYIVFAQDDVLLNPRVNERNVEQWFGLSSYDAFLPHIKPIEGKISNWLWNYQTFWRTIFSMSPVIGSGVEDWLRYLPNSEEFAEKLKLNYGFNITEIEYDINGVGTTWEHYAIPQAKATLNSDVHGGLYSRIEPGAKIKLPFPFCFGMSDFFVLRKDILDKFVEYLTVFSALQLFAEIAVPTALALSSSRIARQDDFGYDVNWLWGATREQIKPEEVVDAFKKNLLLLHPIKLSADADLVNDILRRFK